MLGSSRTRLVVVLLVMALTVLACSSTLSGSPVTGSSGSASNGSTATTSGSRSDSDAPSVPATAGAGTVGASGIGDPYYPTAGNGGYQIDSYDLALSYDPATDYLQSIAHLKGRVTSVDGLTQFNLDLQPTMTVKAVTVNGTDAKFAHDGAKLVITVIALLEPQAALAVDVSYIGRPAVVRGGTGGAPDGGWYRTASGGAYVAGEPISASAWYPVNEHPADTATFAVTATVPDQWQVISNGRPQTDDLPDPGPGKSVFRWQMNEPVASYLTTIYVDKFTLVKDTLADGKPIVSAIAPGAEDDRHLATQTKKIIDFLSGYFGAYPFESAGGIFTGESTGMDLETVTRPIYSGGSHDDETMVVHELSHQWFGDDVTIKRWSDICLNECFASYATWLWKAQVDGVDLDKMWKRQIKHAVDDSDFWTSPLVDMSPGQEFTSVYDRGPLAMHALREEIGDGAFFTLLKQWPAMYSRRHASFDDFEAYVSSLAGRDLKPFIGAWFRGKSVPSMEFRYPGNLGD